MFRTYAEKLEQSLNVCLEPGFVFLDAVFRSTT